MGDAAGDVLVPALGCKADGALGAARLCMTGCCACTCRLCASAVLLDVWLYAAGCE